MKKAFTMKNLILILFSFIPVLIWLGIGFSNNFEASNTLGYFMFLVCFPLLAICTPIKSWKAKIISFVCTTIITIMLIIEGSSNEYFGAIYPLMISIFVLYYLILNWISMKKNK